MNEIPVALRKLLFGKNENEPLTANEQAAWEEYKYRENVKPGKFNLNDPELLNYYKIYVEAENETTQSWQALKAGIDIPPGGASIIDLKTQPIGIKRAVVIAMAVAASIIILVYIFPWPKHSPQKSTIVAQNPSAIPGGRKAMLVTENNDSLDIPIIPPGRLPNINADKISEGIIRYRMPENLNTQSHGSYHQLIVPKGGEYMLQLTDGSKVWLNAYSSLRYPVSFSGNERSVELTGEAYFEVAQNARKPFTVKIAGKEIKVFGTAFNIQGYRSDSIVTTLIKGEVTVKNEGKLTKLQPKDKVIMQGTANRVIPNVNTDNDIAWKNGIISLEGKSLTNVLEEIGRWYNIDIDIDHLVPSDTITLHGHVKKDISAKELLASLQVLGFDKGIKFKIEGRVLVAQKS